MPQYSVAWYDDDVQTYHVDKVDQSHFVSNKWKTILRIMEWDWRCVGHELCGYFEGRRRHDEGWHTRDMIMNNVTRDRKWMPVVGGVSGTRLSVRSSHDELLGGMVNISLRGSYKVMESFCWLLVLLLLLMLMQARRKIIVLLSMANAHSQNIC